MIPRVCLLFAFLAKSSPNAAGFEILGNFVVRFVVAHVDAVQTLNVMEKSWVVIELNISYQRLHVFAHQIGSIVSSGRDEV